MDKIIIRLNKQEQETFNKFLSWVEHMTGIKPKSSTICHDLFVKALNDKISEIETKK